MGETDHSVQKRKAVSEASNGSNWLTPGKFALLLGVLIVAFFPDAVFMDRGFVLRDFGIFTYPNAYFQRESFWHGEIPLWNPFNNCGIPFLAQWNTACLYPLSLIYLLLPLAAGLKYFMLLHLFIAGLGMYLLASQWTTNRLAAAVAGVAFAFNGLTLNCLMWCSNLAALAWMPWVILCAEQAILRGGRRPLTIAALVGGLQMLSGAPEIIVFTWLVVGTLALGRIISEQEFRRRAAGRLALIVGLVSFLAAAQLLPFLELLSHSERTTSYGNSLWSIPFWGWANLFVPLFHCYKAPLGIYFQPSQDWTSSYYLGLTILALALVAVLRCRKRLVWLLAMLAAFGFWVALGDAGGLYPFILKVFPPLGFMRFPVKFAFLTVFSVPLLAAFGMAQLQAAIHPTREWKWAGGIAAFFVAMVAGILCYAHARPTSDESWSVLVENGGLRLLFLALIFGSAFALGKIQNARSQILTTLFLVLCFWLDIVTHAPRQNPTVTTAVFQPDVIAQRMDPVPKPGQSRAFMTRQSHDLFYGSMLTEADKDYIGRRLALLGNCNLLEHTATPDGFYSLYVKDQRSLWDFFFGAPTNVFYPGFADFLAISQISDPGKVASWQPRPTSQPIYSIGAKPEFVEMSNTPALLLSDDFDPRKTVYLPPEAKAQLAGVTAAQGTVRETGFAAKQMDFDVSTESPTLLVLSQTYYSPWHAYLDGKPVDIFQANLAFQAVAVPQGSHHVKLVYQDRRFYLGAILSIAALIGCLMMLVPGRKPIKH